MSDLAAAAAKLEEAQKQYLQALDEKRRAGRDECEAVNRLNDAQRAFDSAVAQVRKACVGGDWKADREPKLRGVA